MTHGLAQREQHTGAVSPAADAIELELRAIEDSTRRSDLAREWREALFAYRLIPG